MREDRETRAGDPYPPRRIDAGQVFIGVLIFLGIGIVLGLVVYAAVVGSKDTTPGPGQGADLPKHQCIAKDGLACLYLKENQCMPKDWGLGTIAQIAQTPQSHAAFSAVFGPGVPAISNPIQGTFNYVQTPLSDQTLLDLYNSIDSISDRSLVMLRVTYNAASSPTGYYQAVEGNYNFTALESYCSPNDTCKATQSITVVTASNNTVMHQSGPDLCASLDPVSQPP